MASGDAAASEARNSARLATTPPSIDTAEGVREVLRRAARGDEAVLPLLRRIFDREGGQTLVAAYGDAYAQTRRSLTESAASGNLAVREALARTIDALRDEIAGPESSPLERILAERIALCWFDAHETDRRFHDEAGAMREVAGYRESRRDRALQRFLAACRTLASVRRLGVPALQINVARRQVNAAGPAS